MWGGEEGGWVPELVGVDLAGAGVERSGDYFEEVLVHVQIVTKCDCGTLLRNTTLRFRRESDTRRRRGDSRGL